jgi:hypothetical protein
MSEIVIVITSGFHYDATFLVSFMKSVHGIIGRQVVIRCIVL